ncbi:MAG: ankyrin repeat domain-containing protein [Acidobacteriota bacterium]|jgi:ankyrin repeat protein
MAQQELTDAVEQGDSESVSRLLDTSPGLATQRDEQGVSWILHALYHRQPAIAELIASHRDDLDLHEAAALGRLEHAERVLAAQPDAIAARSPDGFTPLHYAAFFGRPDMVALLTDLGADVNAVADNPTRVCPLHSAAACADVESCRRLLAAGANPDAQQQAGYTALMSAALHGNRELADTLLAAGAATGIATDDGRTAADFAREGEHDELAQLLAATA